MFYLRKVDHYDFQPTDLIARASIISWANETFTLYAVDEMAARSTDNLIWCNVPSVVFQLFVFYLNLTISFGRIWIHCSTYYSVWVKKRVNASHTRYLAFCPGTYPGIQAVSPQVAISHPPGGRLPLLSTRPAVTFPVAEHYCPLAGTMLYCLVTEAHRCEQLAQGCYAALSLSRIWTHDLLIASSMLYPLHHRATWFDLSRIQIYYSVKPWY